MTDKSTKEDGSVDLQLTMPKRSHERLLALQKKTEAGTPGPVVANALQLYETLIQEAEAGATFFIKRIGDTEPKPYTIF